MLVLASGCDRERTVDAVDRFDVDIVLESDGSASIRETVDVRNPETPIAVFERRIAAERTDGFFDISQSIDRHGAAAPPRAESVTIDSAGSALIRWRLTVGATHKLEARYRAAGVVETQGMRGTFSWPVLPGDRQYEIAVASVSLRLPSGTRWLQPPQFDAPGWQWTTTGEALVATKINVGRTETALLNASLALDAVPMLEPRWQTRAALGQQLVPAFIAAGLFILVTAAGILWAIRLQYFRSLADADLSATGSRREVARGLRIAGIVVVGLGLGAALLAYTMLRSLGPWPQAVAASLVLSGVWFVAAGRWWELRTIRFPRSG
jgi:hypothetical protein